jgi:hypothetical protein
MKKLFLILITLITASSLPGMRSQQVDYSKLPLIMLPQLYYHFRENMDPDMELSSQQADSSIDCPKLSPITLPQIYQHFSEVLLKDVAFHIFTLQPGTNNINMDIPYLETKFIGVISTEILGQINSNLKSVGHCLTVELLKRNLARKIYHFLTSQLAMIILIYCIILFFQVIT